MPNQMKINKDLIISDTNYTLETLCNKINNLEKYITPVILWSGNATTNNLTLSANPLNFARIKVYTVANGIHSCTEINGIVENRKYPLMTESEAGINNYLSFSIGDIYFTSTSLMWFKNLYASNYVNSNMLVANADWYKVKISKVEGYYI